ncbi:hypothetical protein BC936DRAFT_148860, partial [Jimgerdemannia flammicorona]
QFAEEFANIIHGHFTDHTNDDLLTFIVYNQTSMGNYSLITLTGSSLSHIDLSTNPIITVLNNALSVIPINNPTLYVYNFETNSHKFGILVNWTQYYVNLIAVNNKDKIV